MSGKRLFRGGVHPPEEKHRTAHLAVEAAPLPERLYLPASQHIGAPAKIIVAKGDKVLGGQVIAEAGGFVSVPIHASTSGTVRSVGLFAHPLGAEQPAVEIEADGEDRFADPLEAMDPKGDPTAIRRRIQEAGLVGMGGATFPTHVKLSPPPEMKIDAVLLNGAECEPYLTADHRLMVERADEILKGLEIILHLFGLQKGFIGIEKNKPDAIAALTERAAAMGGFAEVRPLTVAYPQGAEKQLIHAILGRDVPSGQLPMAVGAVVQNVATAAAIYEAVVLGRPLVSRIATVTGDAVRNPANLAIRTGMQLSHLVGRCGGLTDDAAKLVMGGPMMGLAQHSLDVPATKGTSGVLCLPKSRVATAPESDCIGCGRCVTGCPMGLAPTSLARLIRGDRVAEADERGSLDCIECGSCSFVCPARIPLVHYIRYAKGRVMARRRAEKG